MFFIMGINQGRKALDYHRMVICNECGSYGRYQVFMVYTYFSLFFIPLFKWGKHYYMQMSCCGAVYELAPEKGRAIARGDDADILPSELSLVKSGRGRTRHCRNCGFETNEEFQFCPQCGSSLER